MAELALLVAVVALAYLVGACAVHLRPRPTPRRRPLRYRPRTLAASAGRRAATHQPHQP